jgi:hypothetical protein
MTWQQEMQRDAARIAFPDWDLRADDIIEVGICYWEGVHTDVTFEPGSTEMYVSVRRKQYENSYEALDDSMYRRRDFINKDAECLWKRLMTGRG